METRPSTQSRIYRMGGRVSDSWGQDHGGLNQPLIQTLLVGASQDGQMPSDDTSLEPMVS